MYCDRNAKKAPGAAARVAIGSRLSSFVAQHLRLQASTRHGNDMKAQLPMLTLMHDARALELFEAVH